MRRGQQFDPSALLGENGIYDASETLDRMGMEHPAGLVFAATQARANADFVLDAVLRGGSPEHDWLDDSMDTDEEKQEVFLILDVAIAQLDVGHVQSIW